MHLLGRRQGDPKVVQDLAGRHLRHRATAGFDVKRVTILPALPPPEVRALLDGVDQGCGGKPQLFCGPTLQEGPLVLWCMVRERFDEIAEVRRVRALLAPGVQKGSPYASVRVPFMRLAARKRCRVAGTSLGHHK